MKLGFALAVLVCSVTLAALAGGSARAVGATHRAMDANGTHSARLVTATAADEVPVPTVTGPIAVTAVASGASYPWLSTEIGLGGLGYVEKEYFIEGTARSFSSDGQVEGEAPYKTRIIVRRPAAAKKFDGTVVVEWLNVTGLVDLEIDWFNSWEHFVRSGHAWVGVSAQKVGVDALKRYMMERYASLDVSSDDYSLDIFSQAVKAVRTPGSVDPLGSLPAPGLVIATGHSQSSGTLHDYYDTLQAQHRLIDGFMFHGSGGRPSESATVGTKSMAVWSETEVSATGSAEPDTANFRHWESAGSSHVSWKVNREYEPLLMRDRGFLTPKECVEQPHSLIPDYQVLNAAYFHLVHWIRGGAAPPSLPRVQFNGSAIAVDADGNALGGIRLPQHAVPTAQNDGENTGAVFCFLFGSHAAWTGEKLRDRYPARAGYVRRIDSAVKQGIAAGFLLPADAAETRTQARSAEFGWEE
jgi:hypothetical protein